MPHGACNNRIRARLVSCNFNELSYVAEVAWNKSGSPPPTICSKLNRFFFIQILLRFGRRLTSLLDQIYRGPSVPSGRLRACSDYLTTTQSCSFRRPCLQRFARTIVDSHHLCEQPIPYARKPATWLQQVSLRTGSTKLSGAPGSCLRHWDDCYWTKPADIGTGKRVWDHRPRQLPYEKRDSAPTPTRTLGWR